MRSLLTALVLIVGLVAPAAADDRPNIVLIMSDDMGWSDLGCYGGGMETPNLDSLAAGGLRFTQFYNTGRCCPTRASLLTGLYPHQAGVGWMLRETGHPGYSGGLNNHCVTIAQVLSKAGYKTYMVGKWHVTNQTRADSPKENWPLQRGFDRYYGMIRGGGSYYDPVALTRGNTFISPYDDPQYDPETYYFTRALSDNAVTFIKDHHENAAEEPFFMYVAYTSAHWPMHALPEDIARFKGEYGKGYAAYRRARFERQQEMGLIDPEWELSPQAKQWEDVKLKEWEERCMEVYAAMIYRMDVGIGHIVESLEKTGEIDNTLIFFLQDNGGCAERIGRRDGSKKHPAIPRPEEPIYPPVADSVIRNRMIPEQTRAGYPVRMGQGVMPGPKDTFIAYGEGWANVSNTPFRLYKHYVHEGGISTPLIAHWPAGIARDGELEHQPGHLIDIMATCVDLADAQYPETKDGEEIYPMEGKSLVPAFHDQKIDREAIYWEHEGNRAIRMGKWKLVAKGGKGEWELYNMETDRAELHNLADEQPERVGKMAKKWHTWAERAHVLPVGTWKKPRQLSRDDFSQKRRFEIEGGGELSRREAPYVPKRGFAVKVTLEEVGTEGVLVAQGGSVRGWSLYQHREADGNMVTLVVRGGKNHWGSCSFGLLSEEARTLTAALHPDGRVTFKVDEKMLAQAYIPYLVDRMPIDGLQVGRDAKGLVGNYGKKNAYDGKIKQVVIELTK